MQIRMAKRIENQENLKRYQERLAQLQKEGNLVPSPNLPTNELIQHLAREGEELLKAEGKANIVPPVGKIQPKKDIMDETRKLTENLGKSSKNPYIRARIMVLEKLPEWKRHELARMEQTGNTNNRYYDEFVHEVAILGDSLSRSTSTQKK